MRHIDLPHHHEFCESPQGRHVSKEFLNLLGLHGIVPRGKPQLPQGCSDHASVFRPRTRIGCLFLLRFRIGAAGQVLCEISIGSNPSMRIDPFCLAWFNEQFQKYARIRHRKNEELGIVWLHSVCLHVIIEKGMWFKSHDRQGGDSRYLYSVPLGQNSHEFSPPDSERVAKLPASR